MTSPSKWSLTVLAAWLLAIVLSVSGSARGQSAPTGILLSNNTAYEWCPPGTVVGLLSPVDADVGESYLFQLVSGPGSDHNGGAQIVGNQLRLRYGFDRDFEVFGDLNFKCRIRVTDSSGLWFEQAFVLLMLDDRNEDVDADGLTEQVEEDVHGTSDLVYDSDGDGAGDGVEVAAGTSPTLPGEWPDTAVIGWGDPSQRAMVAPGGSGFVDLATGEVHSLILRENGTVSAWGGEGTFGQTTVPAGLAGVVAVSAGGDYWIPQSAHSLALKEDGSMVRWGFDYEGRLAVPGDLADIVQVAAGRTHCMALTRQGEVIEWGFNPHQGSVMPAGLAQVVAVAAGGFHSVALKSNGTVATWGSHFNGTAWQDAAAPVGLCDVVAVAAGRFHSLALRRDGTVAAWGFNSHGQVTVPAGLTDVVAIAAGGFHSLALRRDGSVVAWGLNSHGQVSVPTAGGQGVRRISAGNFHSLAIRQQAGYPEITSSDQITAAPGTPFNHEVTVVNASPISFQARGLPAGLTIDPTEGVISGTPAGPARQSVRLDVRTDKGLLSQTLWVGISEGSAPTAIYLTPATVMENRPDGMVIGQFSAEDPDAGDSHTFELVDGAGATDNSRFRIASGQLVVDGPLQRDFEQNPAGFSVRVRARDASLNPFEQVVLVAFEDDTSEDVDGDGLSEAEETLLGTSDVMWDSDGDGFGDRFEIERGFLPHLATSAPAGRIFVAWGSAADERLAGPPDVTDVIAVAAGGGHGLALTGAGLVVAWGDNEFNQATPPGDLTGVIAVDAGDVHSVALKGDGTVVAWGDELEGQTAVPTDLSGVVGVAAGGYHTLALKGDGTVVAWGDDRYGQCAIPSGLADVVAVAAGGFHSLALKRDGTVVAWGSEWGGITAVPAGLGGVIGISAGGYHSLALRHDGTVVAWGDTGHNQTLVPDGLDGVVAVSAGWHHSVALKGNGSVVAWGDSSANQCAVPPEAQSMRMIDAGLFHTIGLRQTSDFPGITGPAAITGWPGESTSQTVTTANVPTPAFSAMGLPEALVLDPQTGVISGQVETAVTRAVRVTASSAAGTFSRVIWHDLGRGVPASNILLSGATIMENSPPGTVVGTLSAVDVNAGDSHAFALSYTAQGPDDFRFEIVGNELRVLWPLAVDFEAGVTQLQVRVRAVDGGGNGFEKMLAIAVLDDRSEDADGDRFNEAMEEDVLGTSDAVAHDMKSADPDGDQLPSLIEHAFNLDPRAANPPSRLVAGGGSTAGLPVITLTGNGAGGSRLRVEYLRRVGAGLTYTAEFSSALSATGWQAATGPVQVETINGTWERCVVEDQGSGARRFGRVRVSW